MGAHVTHLVCSNVQSESGFIIVALEQVQELGTLYNSSGKFKSMYLNRSDEENVTSLKPIYPTHVLTRSASVSSLIDNYGAAIKTLREVAESFDSSTASRANGLQRYLSSGKCFPGLMAAHPIIFMLENLNKSF